MFSRRHNTVREERIGRTASFLVPSLKLKERGDKGATLEDKLHRYLLETFGGYTAAAGNIFGYWKDKSGREFYGEHRRFEVGLLEEDRLAELKRFLAELAGEMGEQCIYLQAGEEALFVYGTHSAD
jgi:hypothetical protein